MKEITFIRQNLDKWKQYELLVGQSEIRTPDRLADAYIEASADLAFSQTHFPDSRITVYLNTLVLSLHRLLYRHKRQKWSRFWLYWKRDVPHALFEARQALFISALFFLLCVVIGGVSTLHDAHFPELILGSDYVSMTIQNIENGNPMQVYASESEADMFLQITVNNLLVAFKCFAVGILTSLATGYLLLYNGIMVGTFLVFLSSYGLTWESFLTVMQHGTIELSSIVVAGGAGIVMGNGWLFPGTYSRMVSFRKAAVRGLRVLSSTIPLFVLAGFIESFVTRHVWLPDWIRMGSIFLSAVFVVCYYVYLPYKVSKYGNREKENLIV